MELTGKIFFGTFGRMFLIIHEGDKNCCVAITCRGSTEITTRSTVWLKAYIKWLQVKLPWNILS